MSAKLQTLPIFVEFKAEIRALLPLLLLDSRLTNLEILLSVDFTTTTSRIITITLIMYTYIKERSRFATTAEELVPVVPIVPAIPFKAACLDFSDILR